MVYLLEDGLHYQYSIIGMVCMDILQLVLRDYYLKQGVFHFANTFYAQYTQLYTAGATFPIDVHKSGNFSHNAKRICTEKQLNTSVN